jgi:hypothetical protein
MKIWSMVRTSLQVLLGTYFGQGRSLTRTTEEAAAAR